MLRLSLIQQDFTRSTPYLALGHSAMVNSFSLACCNQAEADNAVESRDEGEPALGSDGTVVSRERCAQSVARRAYTTGPLPNRRSTVCYCDTKSTGAVLPQTLHNMLAVLNQSTPHDKAQASASSAASCAAAFATAESFMTFRRSFNERPAASPNSAACCFQVPLLHCGYHHES